MATKNLGSKTKEVGVDPEKLKPVFLVWEPPPMDSKDSGYWSQYTSVEDAVSDKGDGTEVFVAHPRRLGCYNRRVVLVRLKPRVRRKAKKVPKG